MTFKQDYKITPAYRMHTPSTPPPPFFSTSKHTLLEKMHNSPTTGRNEQGWRLAAETGSRKEVGSETRLAAKTRMAGWQQEREDGSRNEAGSTGEEGD